MARTVLSAINASNEALKPVPPADLHEQMAAALREMGDCTEPIPGNAWTREYMAENFNLSLAQSSRRIKHWLNIGKIKKAGRKGYVCYYVFTDAVQAKS